MMTEMRSVCATLVLLSVTVLSYGFEVATVVATPPRKQTILRLSTRVDDKTREATRDELLELISGTPRNAPTPTTTTAEILRLVKQLEPLCPTEEDEVLNSLGGAWELLWTAQVR